jgi:hypothetical protein
MEKLKPTGGAQPETAGVGAEKVDSTKEMGLESLARSIGKRAERLLIEGYEKKTDGRVLAFAELSEMLHEHDSSLPIVDMAPNASLDEVRLQAETLAAAVTRIVKETGIDRENYKPGDAPILDRLAGFDHGPYGMITGSLMTSESAQAIRDARAKLQQEPRKDTGDELQYPGFGGGGF